MDNQLLDCFPFAIFIKKSPAGGFQDAARGERRTAAAINQVMHPAGSVHHTDIALAGQQLVDLAQQIIVIGCNKKTQFRRNRLLVKGFVRLTLVTVLHFSLAEPDPAPRGQRSGASFRKIETALSPSSYYAGFGAYFYLLQAKIINHQHPC